jgi:hypothetical protein
MELVFDGYRIVPGKSAGKSSAGSEPRNSIKKAPTVETVGAIDQARG